MGLRFASFPSLKVSALRQLIGCLAITENDSTPPKSQSKNSNTIAILTTSQSQHQPHQPSIFIFMPRRHQENTLGWSIEYFWYGWDSRAIDRVGVGPVAGGWWQWYVLIFFWYKGWAYAACGFTS
jgi:hypothetical protein